MGYNNGKYNCAVQVQSEWYSVDTLCKIGISEIESLKKTLHIILKDKIDKEQATDISLGNGCISMGIILHITGSVELKMKVTSAHWDCSFCLMSDTSSLFGVMDNCDDWLKVDVPFIIKNAANQNSSPYRLSLHKTKDYGDYSELLLKISNENLQLYRSFKSWKNELDNFYNGLKHFELYDMSLSFCPLGEFICLNITKKDNNHYMLNSEILCHIHERSDTLHINGDLSQITCSP